MLGLKVSIPLLALAAAVMPMRAATIASVVAGSDYYATGGSFAGENFIGIPVGPANTDTIIQRTQEADFSSLGTTQAVNLLMTTLSMESTTAFSFNGGPTGFYFITLQSARSAGEGGPGPSSTGSMSITLNSLSDGTSANPEGTFTSAVDIFFDVRFAALNGPIVFSSDLNATNSGANWDATQNPNTILVPGTYGSTNANFHTNLTGNQMDFFVPNAFTMNWPAGLAAEQTLQDATSPEPGTIVLLSSGLLMWACARRLRRSR